jgi:hypothetical protein
MLSCWERQLALYLFILLLLPDLSKMGAETNSGVIFFFLLIAVSVRPLGMGAV